MDVTLVMFKEDGTRRDFPLQNDRAVIGRRSTCDLRIPLPHISREHCEIRIDHDEHIAMVLDLNSSNGTYLNNDRIESASLQAGDRLHLGPVVFTIVIDNQPAEPDPVTTILASRDEAFQRGADDSAQTAAPGLSIEQESESGGSRY